MSRKGDSYFLSEQELAAAFERAKADGQDYLVCMRYADAPAGRFSVERLDSYEKALAVTMDSREDDFEAFLKDKPNARIHAVYNLSRAFAEAAMPEGNYKRTQASFDKVKARLDAAAYQKRMDERPLWRKVLGLQPR